VIVLDTDHLSDLEWPRSTRTKRLRARLQSVPATEVFTTILNCEEQIRGWLALLAKARALSKQIEVYHRFQYHLQNYGTMSILAFDERAAVEYQRLQPLRLRVGAMDLRIAAIVLSHGATLLTRNSKDFRRIPGLLIEDWTA
jgi:tRNA(fMet)-specific endonuclease VapC